MKSVVLSFIILFSLLIVVKSGVIDILSSKAFHYGAIVLFLGVIGCAYYFVGIKERPGLPDNPNVEQPDEDVVNEK